MSSLMGSGTSNRPNPRMGESGGVRDSESPSGRFRLPLFCTVTFLFWFSLYTYVPFFAPHIEGRGASHFMAGLILAAYGLTQTLLRIPLGIASDRARRRKPFIMIGLLSATLSGLCLAFADSPALLLVGRALAGVAAAAWVAFTVLYASYFPKSASASALSTMTVTLTAGNTVGMFVGGRSAELLGASFAFWLAAGAGALGLMLSTGILDHYEGSAARFTGAELIEVAGDRSLRFASWLAFVMQIVSFATIYGFTPVYAAELGATKASLANLALASSVPAAVASFMVGRTFIPRLGETATAGIGFVISGVFTVTIPLITTLPVLYVTQLAAGFGRGMMQPALLVLSIKEVQPERRATAMGVYQAIYGTGMVLGPLVAGIVGDAVGLGASFILMGIVSLAAFGVSLWRPIRAAQVARGEGLQ